MKLDEFKIKAILLGFIVNLTGTYLSTGLLVLGYFSVKGISTDNFNEVYSDHLILGILLITGLAWSMLGGYICARTAKKSEYFNAAFIGVIGLAMSSYSFATGDPSPIWYKLVALIAEIPITLLGVKLARLKREEPVK
ncbi:hypothetical protein [Paenibacillus piri]|uniref:Uncharacterized protein n=1 Tax=Paenibacillus piri TaxID=2547395 RepID=A0A4R5KU94_9BACL|nr:hypothetical protein [Paenibacillus piri]TDF99493.1 hypothetical protein E1757_06485 [Paenibacillus piri]